MELREILVVLGVVLIAVILWDGLRRMRDRKAAKYSGSFTQDPEELRKQAEIARELPNGGARVRDMTEEERDDLSSKLNLRERVPMLMDPVDQEPEADAEPARVEDATAEQQSLDFDAPPPEPERPVGEPEAGDTEDTEMHFSAMDDFEPDVESPPETAAQPEPEEAPRAPETARTEGEVAWAESAAVGDGRADETGRSEERPGRTSPEPAPAPERAAEPEPEPQYQEDTRPVEELVIIHVMAREGRELAGSDLLELLIRAGLRFGPLDIFHYRNPKGQMEFSLANCVQPGTLNPDAMEQFTTPGVTLFMQLPLRADMLEAFDHMYEMALFLAKQLDAVLLDEEHSTVTPQRVEHYRERLRNFARAQMIQAHE